MKKYLTTSLIIAGLVAGVCAQPVLASDPALASDYPGMDVVSEDAGTESPAPEENVVLDNDYETPVEITGGKLVELPAGDDLYKEGHVFIGWNTDPNATDGFFEYVMPNEDVTLYAIWAPVDGGKEEIPAPEAPETTPPATDDTEQQPVQPETSAPETPDAGQSEEIAPPAGPSEGNTDEPQTEPQQPAEDAGGNKGEESGTAPSEPEAGTGDGEAAGGDTSTEPPADNTEGDAGSSEPESEAAPEEGQPSGDSEGSASAEAAPEPEAGA